MHCSSAKTAFEFTNCFFDPKTLMGFLDKAVGQNVVIKVGSLIDLIRPSFVRNVPIGALLWPHLWIGRILKYAWLLVLVLLVLPLVLVLVCFQVHNGD